MASVEAFRNSNMVAEDGYAGQYAYSMAARNPANSNGPARQENPVKRSSSTSYAQLVRETSERIRRQEERAQRLEREEEQRMVVARLQYAAEKQKVNRPPVHPQKQQNTSAQSAHATNTKIPQNIPLKEANNGSGATFFSMLQNVRKEVTGKDTPDPMFLDSAAPFLQSNAHGVKTFIKDEARASSETHQLAISSLQHQLPTSKIKPLSVEVYGDRKNISSFSQSSTNTSTSVAHPGNTSNATNAKKAAPVVPPEDEYITSMDVNTVDAMQKVIDDVRKLPGGADSSDSDADTNADYSVQPIVSKQHTNLHFPNKPQVQATPVSSSPLTASPVVREEEKITHISPIIQTSNPKKNSNPKTIKNKIFNGLETMALNRELGRYASEEKFLKEELSALDKKLAAYSMSSGDVSQTTCMSVSLFSDGPQKHAPKTLEDLAYGPQNDDLTDEQRRQKHLDYLKHQQMHDSKTVKESLSNAAVGAHKFRIQNAEQLKAQIREPVQAPQANKTQYSALAPLTGSTSNSHDKGAAPKSASKGLVAGPMKRVMRRTSSNPGVSEPKILPPVLTGSGCSTTSAEAEHNDFSSAAREDQEQIDHTVHVPNPDLLKTLFSEPVSSSQHVSYGILDVKRTKQPVQPIQPVKPPRTTASSQHSHASLSEDSINIDDIQVEVAHSKGREQPKTQDNLQTNSYKQSNKQPDAKLPSRVHVNRREARSSASCDDSHSTIHHSDDSYLSHNTSISGRADTIVHVHANPLRPGSVQSNEDSFTDPKPTHNNIRDDRKSSANKFLYRGHQQSAQKNKVRPSNVTFSDVTETIDDSSYAEYATNNYADHGNHNHAGHGNPYSYAQQDHRVAASPTSIRKSNIAHLENEFIPPNINLIVSDLLDDDDGLDDYDFS